MYSFRGIPLPEHLKESLDAYVNHGRPTGGFLKAVLENDLRGALARGDEESISALRAITGYLYNEAPQGCWGRKGICDEWISEMQSERAQQKRTMEQLEASVERLCPNE